MAESVDKKQLEEITKQSIKAYKATSKLQEQINSCNNVLKKIDTTKLSEMTNALVESGDASKEATKKSTGLASVMEKIAKSMPNMKTIVNNISKGISNVKKAMEKMFEATGSTESYFKSFQRYTDIFEQIAAKWDEDFELYGSENAKRYSNTFIQQMNESIGQLSGMTVSLSADMESATLEESGIKELGLDFQEVTQFATVLASITNSLEQIGDVSLATANTFTKLAGDMSSYFNVDYSTVVEDLQNALLGESDALEEYRINLSDAKL